jgi:hypothetical protein
LRRLHLDPHDLGRLDVATGTIRDAGVYVEASSGESRVLQAGDSVPDGVWIAQRDLDDLRAGRDENVEIAGRHGFGEGWGAQGDQVGDRAAEPGEGEVLSDAYLPGATGDPTQDPASEQGLSPRVPDPDLAEAGFDQPPVERA